MASPARQGNVHGKGRASGPGCGRGTDCPSADTAAMAMTGRVGNRTCYCCQPGAKNWVPPGPKELPPSIVTVTSFSGGQPLRLVLEPSLRNVAVSPAKNML